MKHNNSLNTIKLLSTLALALGASFANAQTAIAPLTTTATLTASCTISANGVTFGAIMARLNSQSASGNINILCNTGTSYNIALAYGGIYGQLAPGDYMARDGRDTEDGRVGFARYNSAGVLVTGGTKLLRLSTYPTQESLARALGGCTFQPGPGGLCTYSNASYAYGKMIGVAKGDNIAYSISVPGNPGQIWNTGAGSYTGTGTGETQSLPILTKIEPSQSGRPYPTADTYLDTVTATLSY